MGTIWLGYIVAVFAASAFFLAVGWRSRISANAGLPRTSVRLSHTSADASTPNTEAGDVAEAIHVALKRLHTLVQDQDARIEIAVESGLLVRARGDVLADMVAELLALGVGAGSGGRFLLTASEHVGRIEISLSDSSPTEDAGLRRSQARTLAQQVALQGGSLEIVTQSGKGTTMTIRLAGAAEGPSRVTMPPAPAQVNGREPAAQLL